MLPEKSSKSLSTAALALSTSAVVLLLLGYISPQWISAKSARGDDLRFGLWRACYKDSKQNNKTMCSVSNQFMYQGWNEEWLPGVQCMLTFAMLSAVLCVICAWVYKFVPSLKQQPGPVFIALNTSFTTGVLTFLSVLVLGVQQANDGVNFENTTLHWGFGITVVSLALITATCVLLLIEFYDLLFMKSEFKERMSLHRRKLVEILDSELVAKETENAEDLYHDSTENAAFEFPTAMGFENRAYMSEGKQRRRSRHVYDNNVATRDGFRIYDNAATLQPEVVKKPIDEEEDELEHKSVSQQASVRSYQTSNEDKKSLSDECPPQTSTVHNTNGDLMSDAEGPMESGAVSKAGSRKSTTSGCQKDIPLHLFQASQKSKTNSVKSVKSAKSVQSTTASMMSHHETDDLGTPLFTTSPEIGKVTDSDINAESSDLGNGPDKTETIDTDFKRAAQNSSRRTSRKSDREVNKEEVKVKADVHGCSNDQNLTSETVVPDNFNLSTSPITMTDNDLYQK